jgi:hypothetical protein
MVLVLVLILIIGATAAAFGIWVLQSWCPQCGHRKVTRLDGRLLSPELYRVLCQFRWVATLPVLRRWRTPGQHP